MRWQPFLSLEIANPRGPDITLVTPPECVSALESALSQNRYLTALHSTLHATVLAPADLELTTGTAEIFRLPEVQDAITSDFVVLPCDLVCEVSGRALWETWMTLQPPLHDVDHFAQSTSAVQKGGLGVWYQTKDASEGGVGVKKEETDFLATTDLPVHLEPPTHAPNGALRGRAQNVVLSMPTDTLNDELEEKKYVRVRSQLLRKSGKVRMQVKTRDAHLYFLPYWAKEFVRRNESFESFSEDVLGWWAKAGWQSGLGQKLGMDEAMRPPKRRKSGSDVAIPSINDDLDLASLSSTAVTNLTIDSSASSPDTPGFASRVPQTPQEEAPSPKSKDVQTPALLSYIHPSLHTPSDLTQPQSTPNQKPKQPPKGTQQSPPTTAQPPSQLIRRIDTTKLLLSSSLYFARLPSILSSLPNPPPAAAHPFCHAHQIHPSTPLPSQATIVANTVLIDANCTLQPRITIRDSVIGAHCSVASGARLLGCLLMDGVTIEEKVVLSGCVLGRRCKVAAGCELRDCDIQEEFVVAEGTSAKGEVMAGFDEGVGDSDEVDEEDGEGIELGA